MTRRKNKTKHEQRDQPLAVSQGAKLQAADDESCESRLRPWLLCGMTAVLVARPLFPSEAAAGGDGLSVVMLWLALGVFWLLGAIGRRKFSLRLAWADAAVLALVVWTTVSAFWAMRHGTPRLAVNMLWEWVGLGMCFFLARQFIVTARERRAVVAVMVALAVGISGYGLYQVVYELPQTQSRYAADPDRALRDIGMWSPPHSPERKAFEDRLANRQPMGTFALTNSLAAFLAPWAVMLAGVVCGVVGGDSSRRSVPDMRSVGDRSRLLQKNGLAAMLVCLIPIAACLILTKSRSGYAAACVGVVLVWLFGRQRRTRLGWKLPAALGGVAVLLLSAALAVEGPAVLGRASKSFGYRLQYWQSTLDMIAARPWLGCGPGNFQDVYTQYKLPEASEEIADPHNFLLEVWATAGTPAAIAFLAVLGCFVGGIRDQGAGGGGQSAVGGRQSAVTREEMREERGEGEALPPSAFRPPPSANPHSPIPNLCDGWLHVLGGGALGFLLSIPLGILSAAPPAAVATSIRGLPLMLPVAVLIGLPLAAATVVLMFGWIREGDLPRWLPGVGVAAILVALLAAGGIAMPGVAATFWLLLALGLEGCGQRFLPTSTAWVGLAGLLALAVACYGTAYEPVLHCQAELQLAEHQPTRAVAHLEAAAAADPLSAEPWRQLAADEFEDWVRQPDMATFDHFTEAKDEALKRAPNSAELWMTVGDWEFRAFSLKNRPGRKAGGDALQSAIEAYGHAVQLYPNSALCHAKLAETYLAAADRATFGREAKTALRLDRITPHQDKKLPRELRDRLRQELEPSR
jgi:cytochrome c-type biogenesis protein CcmH/NrfG